MRTFLINLLLALTWSAMIADFSLPSLLTGFVLGALALAVAERAAGRRGYFRKVPLAIGFLLFYLQELVLSTLRVAYDVVTPGYRMRPGVLAVPLDARTDLEITLLANLITMTPGTLSLDVSRDRAVLYVHTMFLGDPERLRHEIKAGLERRVLELLR